MESLFNLDQVNLAKLHNEVFSKMYEGNAILFLGAGASVTESHKFLSQQIIELYQDKIHKDLKTNNLVEFIDILSYTDNFSRTDFDSFVFNLLDKLEPTSEHKILATVPWRAILTTNMDMLIEKAYDLVKHESDHFYEIVPILELKQYHRYLANNQIKLIKLNGCIFERKTYPFVFSSEDFRRTNSFYKVALNDLRNVPDSMIFLSIGYSYSDDFSKQLFQNFDKYDFRGRRWFHNVDPLVDDTRIEFLQKHKVRVIKTDFPNFFNLYKLWLEENKTLLIKQKDIEFKNSSNKIIDIPSSLKLNLGSSLKQLNNDTKVKNINPESFYKGEEPDYGIILRDYDVIREELMIKVSKTIGQNNENPESNLLPIYFLTGNFGVGKSTFTYRLLHYLRLNNNALIFEVVDQHKIDIKHLIELFKFSSDKLFILYFTFVERESVFNLILELRNRLSCEQLNSFNILIVSSIRENILERYRYGKDIKNLHRINLDVPLTVSEIKDLLEKLKFAGLIKYRDMKEQSLLIKRIQIEYHSDPYITLLETVKGKHILDLIEAFHELPEIAKNALIYIALLHQYHILMPSSLLRELVASDWEVFRNEIIERDCKGVIIQDQITSYGIMNDLFFRTKHPIIAKSLIENILPNNDDQFEYYSRICAKISDSEVNSHLINDLLKAFREFDIFDSNKLNRLYDIAYDKLSDDPHFLFIYAINLQYRKDLHSLEQALESIIYAESLLERKNHRFIHRRAGINFDLAKYYFVIEKEPLLKTKTFLTESEELFKIKLILDPCSSYSYVNYIEYLIWIIKNLNLDQNDLLRRKIQIEELFDYAKKTVFEDLNKILELENRYIAFVNQNNSTDYFNSLQEGLEDERSRPLVLILLYNYYIKTIPDEAPKIILQLESYTLNDEVGKFLFKYYGRNLHIEEHRNKFMELSTKKQIIDSIDSLRFNYFMYIANDYNFIFDDAKKYIDKIDNSYELLNPDYMITWKNEDGSDKEFEGFIHRNKFNNLRVKIFDFQRNFRITKTELPVDKMINNKGIFKLYFYLNGIRAELVRLIN